MFLILPATWRWTVLWCSTRFNFRSSTVFDLRQWYEPSCRMWYLYADNSCLLFQHKNVTEIKKQLTKDFSNICDCFVDNNLSIHFGEDKTKSKIKQYKHINYLGCMLDESMSGETIALRVLEKINSRLKLLYRNCCHVYSI